MNFFRNWVNEKVAEDPNPNISIPVSFKINWPITIKGSGQKTGLIGLCVNMDVCYLFHVYQLPVLPVSLVQLLSHRNVILHSNTITQYFKKIIS